MNTALTIDKLAQNQESVLSHSQTQSAEIAALEKRIEALEKQLHERTSK